MILDRRGFLRYGLGGAVTMVLAAVAPLLPTQAYAIAGVDDAVVGGVLLVMLTLAGYAVSAEVSQATLQTMGYSFSQFYQDVNRQQAAVTRAIADANNLGVQVNRANAESAATAIAAGTGAIGEWFADVAQTGRMALDGVINGRGDLQAALWGMVAEWQANRLSQYQMIGSDGTYSNGSTLASNNMGQLRIDSLANIVSAHSFIEGTPTWAVFTVGGEQVDIQHVFVGYGENLPSISYANGLYSLSIQRAWKEYSYNLGTGVLSSYDRSGNYSWNVTTWGKPVASSNIVTGTLLPGVDKAPSAPETLGAGYDKTVIGADAVYGPDGDVVSAGTIAVPVQYPHVSLPYVDGLYGLGAGVVPDLLDVPISGQTDIIVGTQEGVTTMTISEAYASDTSISAEGAPVVPDVPVVPPETPDVGPWQPAYNLPFYNVWPFNLVYTFVEQIAVLGGAQ